jgi:long-chain acyl-CoA synthetase
MFMKRVELTPSAAAWMRKRDGRWVTSTWHDFHAVATALATALLDRGLALADKISIVGSTRPEWCIADIAGMLAGAVTVGAYPTLTADQLFYILDHSDSKVVFVEDGEQLAKVLEAKSRLAKLELVVVWDTTGLERELSQHDFVVSFESMLRVESEPARIAQRIARIDPKQTAIIVYTSGTTGPPKGAMISHENILTMLGGATIVEFDESDVGLVFLPMARRRTCALVLRPHLPRHLCRLREQRPGGAQ